MSFTIRINPKAYLSDLRNLIRNHCFISEPKELEYLAEVSTDKHGNILGWNIHKKVISMITTDKLTCSEYVNIMGDRCRFNEYSFHFQPDESNSEINWYRVDLNSGSEDEHINTDPEVTKLNHITPNEALLDFKHFNCLLAILLSLQYIKRRIYPASREATVYNDSLNGQRRRYTI